MTVYIEYVLINNFVIDFLILKAVLELRNKTIKKGKLIICATIGAIASLIYPLIMSVAIINVIVKLLVAILMVVLLMEYKSTKEFYVTLVLFFAVTFILLGFCLGGLSLFNVDYSKEIFIAISAVPIYFLFKGVMAVIKYVLSVKKLNNYKYKCVLTYKDTTIKLDGFLDTGNGLKYMDKPVIIIDKKIFLRTCGTNIPKPFYISYKTVGKNKTMPAFILDKLEIYNGDKKNIIFNVTVGVATVGIEYDVILNPELLGGEYAEKIDFKAKEVG